MMTKSFLMAAAMTISCLCANAQTEKSTSPAQKSAKVQKRDLTPEDRAVRVLRMMTSKAGLTDAQTSEVNQILIEREKAKAAARNEDGTINKDKIADVKAANKKAEDKLQQVLTPEQWNNWEAFKKETKERRAARKADGNKQQMNRPEMEEDFY
ncbi:MAG: hypothetical protein WED33_11225 [Bacteroidia bacterium]